MDNTARPRDCDTLLMESCKTYREIEIVYANILGAIADARPASVEKAAASLTGLLQDVYRIDSEIADNLLSSTAVLAGSTKTLLQQREGILRRLQLSNRTLANKAANIQALIRHEITGMAKNRNALKGYRPVETDKKSIIRSSF